MRARTLVALSVLTLASTAMAAERTVSALDYLVDGVSLVDTPVHITRCNIANASSTVLTCYAFPPGNTKTKVGSISIEGASLNREDLRNAVNPASTWAPSPSAGSTSAGHPTSASWRTRARSLKMPRSNG